MRLLLITLGSHGDTHPFFALARALTARGHEALVATNPAFFQQAARAGVATEALTDGLDMKEILQHPDVMHATRGPRAVLRDLTLPLVPKIYARTAELIREYKPDVAVVHPICLGSHWACERSDVPVVPAVLSPLGWMQSRDRIVFGPWRSHNPSILASRFDAIGGRWIMRWMLDGPLNRVRRELGLPKGRDLLVREFLRPGLNLGLWSRHFRPPRAGDPAGGVICGFPWFDDHHDHTDDLDALDRFLDAGAPPVVFTLGTAAVHVPGDFYQHAADAARLLGRRAVLLVGRSEYRDRVSNLPRDGSVGVFTYAPFSYLLPRAAATVHHGGIGSTAQALRAGRPMVVVPLAHDQFDNAARAKRLGVSETVPHTRADAAALAGALSGVLNNPEAAGRAEELGKAVRTEDGAAAAAGHLEGWMMGKPPKIDVFEKS